MAWHSERRLDVAILITGTKPTNEFSNGAFEKMKEDLVDFNNTLTIPIYLVGLQE